jgi:AraC-like DNA-binding protein
MLFETHDLDEAADYLSCAAIPYVSELLPGSPAFSTRIRVTPGEDTRISRVSTSGALHIRSRLPADSYAIVLDQHHGIGLHRVAGENVVVDSESSLVHSPLFPVEVITRSGFEALFVRLRRDAVVRELEHFLDRPVQAPLIFNAALQMQSAAGIELRRISQALGEALETSGSTEAEMLAIRKIEAGLIGLLLHAQPHNYTRLLNRRSDAGIWQLKTAEEFIREHAHLPLSLGDISRAAGVNVRTLQDAFRRRRGCSPMQFLRNVRMQAVHAGLLAPNETTTVTSEAAHWGFVHFGRFAREYHSRFGELPSQTLRRARNPARTDLQASSVAP